MTQDDHVHSVRSIEELSFNAWPALQTVYHDGWVLRFAEGVTRRANSVNPVYASCLDLGEKIAYCEGAYTQRGLRTVFKITPAVKPDHLDAALEERGYVKEAPTSVQVLDNLALLEAPVQADVIFENQPAETWLAVFSELNNVNEHRISIMRRILANLVPAACYIALRHEGQTASVGLGVLERGYLGIFDIVTAKHLRNRGFGRQLMLNLLHWGRSEGAIHAYLQVMLNNAPALRLYARLGFREVYQYWYRVKSKVDQG